MHQLLFFVVISSLTAPRLPKARWLGLGFLATVLPSGSSSLPTLCLQCFSAVCACVQLEKQWCRHKFFLSYIYSSRIIYLWLPELLLTLRASMKSITHCYLSSCCFISGLLQMHLSCKLHSKNSLFLKGNFKNSFQEGIF